MKRFLLIFAAILGVAAMAPAQSSVGIDVGFSYTGEDIDSLLNGGYTVNPFGCPVFAEYAHAFPLGSSRKGEAQSSISVLGRMGAIHLLSASLGGYDLDTAMYSFPLCAGCRYTVDNLFIDLELGPHFWKVFNSGSDASGSGESGFGFCASVAPGSLWPLTPSLTLRARAELWVFQFPATSTADADASVVVGVLVGLSYRL